MDKLKIALVGAGRTGTPLIEALSGYRFVEIVGVADRDENSPGMQLAQTVGYRTTTDPMELAALGPAVDVMIEVSGDGSFKRTLKDYYESTGNNHTVIMHDIIARLFLSVIARSDTLIETYHPEDNGIGTA